MLRSAIWLFAGWFLVAPPVWAGQGCSENAVTPEVARKALNAAAKTFQSLDATGARAVILGRVGSDISRHGLRYTHAAFVLRDHPKGRWTVVHMLNHCGTAESDLYEEGLGNFFLDDLFAYDALLIIPSPNAQDAILQVLLSRLPRKLHISQYSMIANPWRTEYQNSNQWLLETLAAALGGMDGVGSRAAAQAWLKQRNYQPSRIEISAMERIGARLFRANVTFRDHPWESLQTNKFEVVSVDSIARFVLDLDKAAQRTVIRP